MIKNFGKKELFKYYESKSNDNFLIKWGLETVDNIYAKWYEELFYKKPTLDDIFNVMLKSNNLDVKAINDIANILLENPEEYIRKALITMIVNYDISSNVNLFYLNDLPVWFNKELRVCIKNQILARQFLKLKIAPIIFNDTILQIPIELGLQLLAKLEIYASDCYNVTALHKNNIKNMSIEDMLKYDYTKGYPDKLNFTINS